MKIAKFAVLLTLPLASALVAAPPARPPGPKPCVLMPRQGANPPPVARPRGDCATAAFPRAHSRLR